MTRVAARGLAAAPEPRCLDPGRREQQPAACGGVRSLSRQAVAAALAPSSRFRDYVLYLHEPVRGERARPCVLGAPASTRCRPPRRCHWPSIRRASPIRASPACTRYWRQRSGGGSPSAPAAAGLTPSSLLLSRLCRGARRPGRASEDFTLNLTVGDRRPLHPDLAGMLGVFTTLLPLEVRGACRGAFLARARPSAAAGARPGSSRVQRRRGTAADGAAGRRSASRPVAGGVHQRPRRGPGALPEEVIEVVHSITQTPQTWLDNKVYEQDEGLGIDWDAPAALFPRRPARRRCSRPMSGCCTDLADSDSAWAADARRTLLAGAQSARCSPRVNATQGRCPTDLLHEPVFAAAAAHPEARRDPCR